MTLQEKIEGKAQLITDRFFGKGATIDKSDWDFTVTQIHQLLTEFVEEIVGQVKLMQIYDYDDSSLSKQGQNGYNQAIADIQAKIKTLIETKR